MLVSIAPLARTPMDKRGSSSLRDYGRKLERVLESWTPWRKRSQVRARQKGLKSGELRVILGPGESDLAKTLFKDSKVIHKD
jgi:hypothetical protein